jgi:hypothetical protein
MPNVKRVLTALLVAGFGTALAAAPDFSGEWKLNVDKCDFGMAPPISSRTDKIVHKDPSLKITRTQTLAAGSGTSEYTCTTDGKDCDITVTGAAIKVTGAFKWVDNSLIFDGKGTYNGGDLIIHEKWSLSPDHAKITIERHFSAAMGETDQTLLLEKQ